MSTPSNAALRASEVSVRTTPLTCGCQASVATKIRIRGALALFDSSWIDVRTKIFQAYDVIELSGSFLLTCEATPS
jgi:hypothetical protein